MKASILRTNRLLSSEQVQLAFVIPEIANQARDLTVLQHTKFQRAAHNGSLEDFHTHFCQNIDDWHQKMLVYGMVIWTAPPGNYETPKIAQSILEDAWKIDGASVCFEDILLDQRSNDLMADFITKNPGDC